MSATIAADILAGAVNLSPAQEKVMRETQGYVRNGRAVNAATRRVLTRLGMIEKAKDSFGFFTTPWGDAVGEELVAREVAKGERLPEILWEDGQGWIAGRFQIVIESPGVIAFEDTRNAVTSIFKTIVHAQQLAKAILAEEKSDRLAVYAERYAAELELAQTKPFRFADVLAEQAAEAATKDFDLVCEELLDNVKPMDLHPGDRITGIDGEWFKDDDGPVVAEAARQIYGDSGPWGVRLVSPRTVVNFLYVENVGKVSVRRPCRG